MEYPKLKDVYSQGVSAVFFQVELQNLQFNGSRRFTSRSFIRFPFYLKESDMQFVNRALIIFKQFMLNIKYFIF